MIYIALLRGINVGGKAKIHMAELKTCFESLGFEKVRTLINSGNVVFEAPEAPTSRLAGKLEQAIIKTFSLQVRVLVKTPAEMRKVAQAVPADWVNDANSKCDVLFLWPEVDNPDVLGQIPNNPEIETADYYPGAVLHRVSRQDATRSRLTRIVGTPLYASITIRNINTVRKLLIIVNEVV